MEAGGSHMNVSYHCLIFHTGYTVHLNRFTNLMSIGPYFRLSHSTPPKISNTPHNIFPERNTDFKMNVPQRESTSEQYYNKKNNAY